jgi:hypothetical protein
MIRKFLLSILTLTLVLSSAYAFLYLESPLKAIAIAQTDTTPAKTKQPQPSFDQNQTGLGLVKTSKIIESGNTSSILKLLSNVIEARFNKSSSLLELTSKLPVVTNVSYSEAITERFMGIPQDLDLQKRDVAQSILEQDRYIASIFFVTPKGDTYLGEPYHDQQQLPRLNYADRDWYKGVTRTSDTYTSAVFFSAAIHVPAIAIAVPVYGNSMDSNVSVNVNQTSPSIVGYWVGIINPVRIIEDLSSIINPLNPNNKVLFIDHNGTRVFEMLAWPSPNLTSSSSSSSSSPSPSPLSDSQNQSLKSFSYLQSVQNALDGQSGSTEESINGVKTTIYHHPVQIYPHTWALLLLETSE